MPLLTLVYISCSKPQVAITEACLLLAVYLLGIVFSCHILLFIVSVPESVTHVTRNEELVFEPRETSKTLSITLVDDQVAGDGVEVFTMQLTPRPGQPVDTSVQNGLVQVLVFDNDESMYVFICQVYLCIYTVTTILTFTCTKQREGEGEPGCKVVKCYQ